MSVFALPLSPSFTLHCSFAVPMSSWFAWNIRRSLGFEEHCCSVQRVSADHRASACFPPYPVRKLRLFFFLPRTLACRQSLKFSAFSLPLGRCSCGQSRSHCYLIRSLGFRLFVLFPLLCFPVANVPLAQIVLCVVFALATSYESVPRSSG